MNNQQLQKSKQGIYPPSPIICGIHKTWWQNTWGPERHEVLQKEFSVRQGWLRLSKKDACSHRDYITKEFKDGCFHDCGSKTLQTISLSPSVQALVLPSSLESRKSLRLLQISRRKKKKKKMAVPFQTRQLIPTYSFLLCCLLSVFLPLSMKI